MKAEMCARMIEDNKINFQLRFSGKGHDNAEMVCEEAQKYSDAKKIGMKWNHCEYTATVDATPEECAPFISFAEKHKIEIVQM